MARFFFEVLKDVEFAALTGCKADHAGVDHGSSEGWTLLGIRLDEANSKARARVATAHQTRGWLVMVRMTRLGLNCRAALGGGHGVLW